MDQIELQNAGAEWPHRRAYRQAPLFFSMISEQTLASATSRRLDEASIVAEKRCQAVGDDAPAHRNATTPRTCHNEWNLMRDFKIALSLSTISIAVVTTVALCMIPSRAQTPSAAAAHIQTYYQELMPTIQQAGRLSVRERDKRFGPAITSAFDLATMTRLAVGPAWKDFSAAQRAAVQEAFTRFIVADYASQINDYSGESFIVDPQTSPETRGGGEIVKTRLLQPSGRTVSINYLVRGGRVIDVYLNGTISDLATRRDEFASIIASGGADGLIKRLQDRTQTLLGR
jgi:phospholipid transport system substrate-binding protein